MPGGSTDTSLQGVSCLSASDCEAAGLAEPPTAPDGEGLIEHWNGTAWSVQDKVLPSGDSLASLSGISCLSASVCEAGGQVVPPSGAVEKVLALRYS